MTSNLVELVLRDHQRESELFQRVLEAPRAQAREDVLADLVALLVSHEAAESLVFYPALNHFIPDGDRIAHACIDEHRNQETLLARVRRLGVHHRAFASVFEELSTCSLSHVREEERLVIPMMRAAGSGALLRRLGERYVAVRAATALHVPLKGEVIGTPLRRLVNDAHRKAHLALARREWEITGSLDASRGAA